VSVHFEAASSKKEKNKKRKEDLFAAFHRRGATTK
jgi:hypothetical protein